MKEKIKKPLTDYSKAEMNFYALMIDTAREIINRGIDVKSIKNLNANMEFDIKTKNFIGKIAVKTKDNDFDCIGIGDVVSNDMVKEIERTVDELRSMEG